jgi:hypothetical protein
LLLLQHGADLGNRECGDSIFLILGSIFFEPTDASSHRSVAVANKQAFVFHAQCFQLNAQSIESHNGRAPSDFTSCNGF